MKNILLAIIAFIAFIPHSHAKYSAVVSVKYKNSKHENISFVTDANFMTGQEINEIIKIRKYDRSAVYAVVVLKDNSTKVLKLYSTLNCSAYVTEKCFNSTNKKMFTAVDESYRSYQITLTS